MGQLNWSQRIANWALVGAKHGYFHSGYFGYAIITSPNYRWALRLMVRYNRSLMPILDCENVVTESRVEVRIKATAFTRWLRRFVLLSFFMRHHAQAAILNSPQSRISVHVEFAYDCAYDKNPLSKIICSKVKFNSNSTACWVLNEAGLNMSIVNRHPVARDISKRCDRLIIQ